MCEPQDLRRASDKNIIADDGVCCAWWMLLLSPLATMARRAEVSEFIVLFVDSLKNIALELVRLTLIRGGGREAPLRPVKSSGRPRRSAGIAATLTWK